MFSGGVGGGAIGVPLYACPADLPCRADGPVWMRLLCGVVFASMVPIWIFTVTGFGGPRLAVSTARVLGRAWYWSLMVVLAMAAAIPHRPVVRSEIVHGEVFLAAAAA
jgi:hypothetical protein